MISCTLDVQRCSLPCRGCCALWSENDGLRLIWSHVNSQHFHLIYQLGVKNVSRWAGPRERRSPILTLQCCCCCPPPVSSQWQKASIQGLPLMLICKLAILFKSRRWYWGAFSLWMAALFPLSLSAHAQGHRSLPVWHDRERTSNSRAIRLT